MIAAILNIDELHQSILVIVIEKENLERMKKADPITLESTNNGGVLTPPKYPQDFNILIAHEEDDAELYHRARGDRIEFLRWLERGRIYVKGLDGAENSFRIPKEEQS